ncbi:MAG: hypothetical protein HOV80_35450 [Polyangiaceae bacterium]|nr:hypothetical protein [Polyangiaceae bacterium]
MGAIHRSMGFSLRLAVTVVALAGASLVGCNDDTDDNDNDNDNNNNVSGQAVEVTEQEFMIMLNRASVSPGTVTFQVTNAGTEKHEFLVIRTDFAPDALPTEANGSYMENGPGTEIIKTIEDIEPGQTENLTVDLAAGAYVLICNRVETESNGEVVSHYAHGMRTGFQVVGTPTQ